MTEDEEKEQRKVSSFRVEKSILREAKHKARQQNRTMTEVINDLLRVYIGINSPVDELEEEKRELEEEKSRIEARISEIEKEIENKKGKIPDGVAEYLIGDFQEQPDEIKRKRIREFSNKLDMSPEKFAEVAKKEVEGFNGI